MGVNCGIIRTMAGGSALVRDGQRGAPQRAQHSRCARMQARLSAFTRWKQRHSTQCAGAREEYRAIHQPQHTACDERSVTGQLTKHAQNQNQLATHFAPL